MVAVPRLVELVMVTVAIPLLVVELEEDNIPAVVVKLTVVPFGTLFPLESLTVAVIRVLVVPSAGIVSEPAVRFTDPADEATRCMVVVEKVPFVASALMVSLPALVEAV